MQKRLPWAETFGVIVTEKNAKAGAKQHLLFLKLADVAQLSHRMKSENNDMVFSFSQIFSSGWANNENLMNKGVRLTSVSVAQPARVHWKFACLTCKSNNNMAWTSVVEGSHRIMHKPYPIRMRRECLSPFKTCISNLSSCGCLHSWTRKQPYLFACLRVSVGWDLWKLLQYTSLIGCTSTEKSMEM